MIDFLHNNELLCYLQAFYRTVLVESGFLGLRHVSYFNSKSLNEHGLYCYGKRHNHAIPDGVRQYAIRDYLTGTPHLWEFKKTSKKQKHDSYSNIQKDGIGKSNITSELTGCNGICRIDLAATRLLPEIIAEIPVCILYLLLPSCRQAD